MRSLIGRLLVGGRVVGGRFVGGRVMGGRAAAPALALVAAAALQACGAKDAPKEPAPAPPAAAPAAAAPKEAPEPKPEPTVPSPMEQARPALTDFGNAKAVAEAAGKVNEWLQSKPKGPEVAESGLLVAQAQLAGLAQALAGEPALALALAGALGSTESGGAEAAMRFLTRSARDFLEVAGDTPESRNIREGMKVLAPIAAGAPLGPEALAKGINLPGAAGQGVRLVLLSRVGPLAQQIASSPVAQWATALAESPAAALLCPDCAPELGEAGGDATALAQAGNAGVVCAEAAEAAKGKDAAQAAQATTACNASFYGLTNSADAALAFGPNFAPTKALRLAMLAQLDSGDGPLASVLKEKSAAAALAPANPLALPFLPSLGLQPAELASKAPIPAVVTIDAAGVRGAWFPTAVPTPEGVMFLGRDKGYAYPGEVLVSADELLAPPVPDAAAPEPGEEDNKPPTPAEKLRKALETLLSESAGMAGMWPESRRLVAAEGLSPTILTLSPDADTRVVRATVQSLATAGFGTARIATGVKESQFVPAVLHAPEKAGAAAKQVFSRPTLVRIQATKTEVFPPSGQAIGEPKPRGGSLPAGASPWYLWEELFKVDVAAGEQEAQRVAAAARALGDQKGDGNVVLVEVDDAVPPSRWLAVVAAIGVAGDEPIEVSAAYPGVAACTAAEATCPRRLPVLFSGVQPPSSTQLTQEPRKKEKKETPPPPPPKQEASPEFCNKGDIQRVMTGKASAFKFCYERELQTYPDLKGRVVVRFNIPSSGKAEAIKIASSDLKKDSIHACIIKTVEKLTFEKPSGGVCAVNWPLVFTN